MEADELRAEIKRRKKRAVDLKLRELVWNLHRYHLSRYPDFLKRDPAMILPELNYTREVGGTQDCFQIGETRYKLAHKAGKAEEDSRRSEGGFEETVTIPLTFSLYVDDSSVFAFEVKRIERWTMEMPYFSEQMGEVLGFIEGPWVSEIGKLVREMTQHEHAVLEKRNAPRRAQKLREDMKRFGL